MIKKIVFAILVAIVFGCGGGGGGGGGVNTGGGVNNGVNLNTNAASLSFNQSLSLTGTIPGQASQTISWTANGGSIVATGASTATYTSPATPGTFTVTARAFTDPNKFATVIVTVSNVGILIQPAAVTVGSGTQTLFTANVTGTTNRRAIFSATGGTFVTVTDTTALWRAPTTNGTYRVTAQAAANLNVSNSATVTVANVGANAFVTGRTIQSGTNIGIAGMVVAFYNSSGAELGRVTTGADGRFSATVPVTARRFHVLGSSITAAYYKQYEFGALRYSATLTDCTAPLPTLTAGQTAALANNLEFESTTNAPPPPPNGCQ